MGILFNRLGHKLRGKPQDKIRYELDKAHRLDIKSSMWALPFYCYSAFMRTLSLVLQLKNTDSLNKARRESHATQIQLTSEREAAEGARKTEDFFPTLTLNSSFKSWRISIPARVNLRNVEQLGGAAYTALDPWRPDSIQIRRRLLNDDGQGNGNPTLQICYGDDLMPLREQLNVDDYLVIVKRKAEALYDAFGVKSTADLGNGTSRHFSYRKSKNKELR